MVLSERNRLVSLDVVGKDEFGGGLGVDVFCFAQNAQRRCLIAASLVGPGQAQRDRRMIAGSLKPQDGTVGIREFK